jgi:oligopeptide transport system substrate-binding protein
MKRFAASILLVVLALAFVACATPTPQVIEKQVPVPQTVVVKEVVKETVSVPQAVVVTATPAPQPAGPQQILVWSDEGINELPGLDPAQPQNAQSVLVINLVFGGLVKLDAELKVIPDAAQSWDISSDGKTYTFHLRPGLKFADGTPVTAADFVYSINRALAPETASYGAPFQLGHIVGAQDVVDGKSKEASGVKVVDDQTLQITADQPLAYFLSQLTFTYTFVVPRALIEKEGAQWQEQAFGTGPFRVKEWKHGQSITLEANPNYWKGNVPLNEVQIPFIQDSETAFQLYRTGELDIMGSQQNGVPAAHIPEVSFFPDFHQAASLAVRYIGFNNKKAPFDNDRVRRAFAMATDKITLAEKVLGGSVGALDRILPPGMPGSEFPINAMPFDPAMARDELAAAGFPDGTGLPPLKLTYGAEGDNERVATALQGMWEQNLGVRVTLEPMELATFSKSLDTTFLTPEQGDQFYLSIWGADYPDPQNFISQQLQCQSPNNNGHWCNEEFDKLTGQADTEIKDYTKRMQLYNKAEQIAIDEVGWLPLYAPRLNVLIKPYVSGLAFTGMGIMVPDWTAVRGRVVEK